MEVTDLHLVPNVSGLLVEADLHHHQAPAIYPKVEVAVEDLQDSDIQAVDLQDRVEAVVDPQAVDHLLQLKVSSKYVDTVDCHMHPTRVLLWLPTDNRMDY